MLYLVFGPALSAGKAKLRLALSSNGQDATLFHPATFWAPSSNGQDAALSMRQ